MIPRESELTALVLALAEKLWVCSVTITRMIEERK